MYPARSPRQLHNNNMYDIVTGTCFLEESNEG